MKKWIAILIITLPMPIILVGFLIGLIWWALYAGILHARDLFYTKLWRVIDEEERKEDENEQSS